MNPKMQAAKVGLSERLEANDLTRGMYVKTRGDHLVMGRTERFAPDLEPEDIVQEIFLKVYQNINDFKHLPGACFSTWLFTIARHHCVDLMRRKKKYAYRKEFKDKAMNDLPDKRLANPQQASLQNENAARISMAVEELFEPFRSALVLRYYEEMGYNEIAQILHCNEGTAKSRVARAKQMLIKFLNGTGQIR